MTSLRCNRCGKMNPAGGRFCIHCGSPLTPEPEPPPNTPESTGPSQQPQSIEEEIHELREQVARIVYRLDALESRPEITAKPPKKAPPPPAPVPTEKEPLEKILREAGVKPAEALRKPTRAKPREWEQILGGNWLARIGILALIIGIGFFLKYAFDKNWLGPEARVILGTVAGLIMLWLGFHWRKRYPIMTQVLSGGGIAVLYLSIFASFATYHLVSIYIAVLLLLIISFLSTILALRYDSMALAIIGIFGAFFAPYILGAFGYRTGGRTQAHAVQLLAYLIVVDIGVLLLSAFRNWRWFILLAFACSLITYGVWHDQFHVQAGINIAETGITVIFLSFIGATSLFYFIRRSAPQAFDYVLMALNAAAYAGISLGLMWDDFRGWMGGFVLLLAIFYGTLANLAYKRNAGNTRFAVFSLAIALIFLTITIPVQFGNHATTTIAWAGEMVAFAWLSFALKIPVMRYCAYVVFITMVWRLLFFDTSVDINTFKPVVNARFLAFVIGIAAIYLTAFILWRRRDAITREWRVFAPLLLIAASFLTIWIISFEVWQSFSISIKSADAAARRGLENAQNLSLTGVWAIYAVVGLIIGIWRKWRYVRLGSLAILLVAVVKVFVYDVFHLETSYRIGAFVGLGLLLLASAYLYQRYSKVIKGVFTK